MHRNRIASEDEPMIRQHLAEYGKLFPALALIFHLIDCAAHSPFGRVGQGAAVRAAAWCEFLEARTHGAATDC
ncbi:MAG: hypothetical protein GKR94_08075 [Gammaproteobacteria bacterium]|nr:hypothetical protein [Gammaproteobacteria bacterium]